MANNSVGIKFEVNEKVFDEFYKNIKKIQQQLRKLQLPKDVGQQFLGKFSDIKLTPKGNISQANLRKYLSQYENNDYMMQIFSAQARQNIPLLNKSNRGEIIKAWSENQEAMPTSIFKQDQKYLKEYFKYIKFHEDELTKVYKNRINTYKTNLDLLTSSSNQIRNIWLKNPFENLRSESILFEGSRAKINETLIGRLRSSFEKFKSDNATINYFEKINTSIKKLNKDFSITDKISKDFLEKVKTLSLYLSAISVFNFLKDIISVRREMENIEILLSRTASKFNPNSSREANLLLSKGLIQELKSSANYLGIGYGEIFRGFSRFANAIPEGDLTLNQTLDTYKGLMEMFKVTGATSQEQTNAIRAIYQMFEKGSLSAEEFNRQLGNTPLRSEILKYSLRSINKEGGTTAKTLEDIQRYLRSSGKSQAEWLQDVIREFRADPNNQTSVFLDTIDSKFNRLSNSIQEFKESLTRGALGLNPTMSSLSVIITSLTGLINILSKIGPYLSLLAIFILYLKQISNISKGTSANLEVLGKSFKKIRDPIKRFESLQLSTRKTMVSLYGSVLLLTASLGTFLNTLKDIKENGLSFENGLILFGSLAGTISSLIEIVSLLKQIKLLTTISSAMTGLAGIASGVLGSVVAFILNPYVLIPLILAALAGVGYAAYKIFSDDEEEASRANSSTISQSAMTYESSYYNDYHAQVDVIANIPVERKTINTGNLSVNVLGPSIQPASNI